jgi:hypothetical protein
LVNLFPTAGFRALSKIEGQPINQALAATARDADLGGALAFMVKASW